MKPRVLWVSDGSVSGLIRGRIVSEELVRLGYQSWIVQDNSDSSSWYNDNLDKFFDVVVIIRSVKELEKKIKRLIKAGKRVIMNIDDDFFALPKTNPCWKDFGPGNPFVLAQYQKNLQACSLIVAASEELALRSAKFNTSVVTIRNGWSASNPYWGTDNRNEAFFTIGFAGTPTHFEDFKQCKEALEKIVSAHSQIRVAVFGDRKIYQSLFAQNKLFFPIVDYDLYPWILSHMDMLVIPLENNEFNRAKSDIKLLDAAVSGIPFVCSAVLPYQLWNGYGYGGGELVNDGIWEETILAMITSQAQRSTIYAAFPGISPVFSRETKILVKEWENVING